MELTKQEIESDIRELQAQYEALIVEGSYKLAEKRLERIRRLKEKLKRMKGPTENLKLPNSQTDSLGGNGYTILKSGRDPQGNEEITVRINSTGQTKSFRGFDAIKEAYKWIRANMKDSCSKVFTKGSRDEDPKVKSLTYKGYTIRYRPSSGKYYISSGPGDTVSLKHIGKEYANLNEAKYSISNSDECPTFTKGSKDDDATEHGSIEEYGMNHETEKMSLEKDPVQANDDWSSLSKNWTPENIKHILANPQLYKPEVVEEVKKIMNSYGKSRSKVKDEYHGRVRSLIKSRLGSGGGVYPNYETAVRMISRSIGVDPGAIVKTGYGNSDILGYYNGNGYSVTIFKEEGYNNRDSDPKVAEALAIINLCGGAM